MHIEISAGGLRGGVAVASFQNGMKSYISGTEGMISSFKAVASKTYNLNGGVGRLSEAVGQVNSRVSTEESRKSGAETVRRKANDFLDLAMRVDKSVAAMVKQDREELYGKYPALKPTPGQWMKDRLADAWNWLCKKGEAVVTGAKQAITAIKDTLQKAWDSVVAFYEEHKELIGKIVGTVLIVVGAIAAIAAVIATGGLALAPLIGAGLTALGISATTAAAIATVVSAVVGITAVVSTLGASTMNVIDIWFDKSDDATFQTWKKVLNVVSIVTNTAYSIGNLFNAYKGTSGAKYLSENRFRYQSSSEVWNHISPVGPNHPGTELPSQFTVDTPYGHVYTNPNGTKHMYQILRSPEYITNQSNRELMTQLLLDDYRTSLSQAIKNGISYDIKVFSGKWEFIFSKARPGELYPVVKHAVFHGF